MGRNTWQSLPEKYKPLPGRYNIVVSRNYDFISSINEQNIPFTVAVDSIENAFQASGQNKQIENTFVIGGQKIWESVIDHPNLKSIFLTKVNPPNNVKLDADTFFPKIPKWMQITSKNTIIDKIKNDEYALDFSMYTNVAHPKSDERQYLDLLQDISLNGEKKYGRNGNTMSIFGPQHTFDLQDGFPLLTTKRMFFHGIGEELLFFLRGDTNANHLSEKGVTIWNPNTTEEFLKGRGLDYKVGDMGPMYGFNWRFFGTKYKGMDKDYSKVEGGYDQLHYLIESLSNNPNSRRHLLTTFNPATVSESVLAPCHGLTVQFSVRENKYLDCKMYQRSVDVALGYPFNIASYGLLIHLLGKVTGYEPGKLIMTLGDKIILRKLRDKLNGFHFKNPNF
jgi:dihydrofolate reductase/thymidylate synthase